MDIEEKKRKLARMRAAREAKLLQMTSAQGDASGTEARASASGERAGMLAAAAEGQAGPSAQRSAATADGADSLSEASLKGAVHVPPLALPMPPRSVSLTGSSGSMSTPSLVANGVVIPPLKLPVYKERGATAEHGSSDHDEGVARGVEPEGPRGALPPCPRTSVSAARGDPGGVAAALASALSAPKPRSAAEPVPLTARSSAAVMTGTPRIATSRGFPGGALPTYRHASPLRPYMDRTENASVLTALQSPGFLQFLGRASLAVKEALRSASDSESQASVASQVEDMDVGGSGAPTRSLAEAASPPLAVAVPLGPRGGASLLKKRGSMTSPAASRNIGSAGTALLATRRACFANPAACCDRLMLCTAMAPEGGGHHLAVAFSRPCKRAGRDQWHGESSVLDAEADGGIPGDVAPRGLVLVWSTRRLGQPQRFVYEEEVRCIAFCAFHGYIIFGGAVNGRIVVWNLLQGETPVAVSFPSPEAHQVSVVSIAAYGDANSHSLFSVSSDGRLCAWSVGNLRRPTVAKEALIGNQQLGCVVSCAAIVDNTTDVISKLFLGTIDGILLLATSRTSRVMDVTPVVPRELSAAQPSGTLAAAGGSSAVDELVVSPAIRSRRISGLGLWGAKAPAAPGGGAIVSIAAHPPHADPRVSELVLTAGLDGTCSLWLGEQRVTLVDRGGSGSALHAVCWSPTHPAVFAVAEESGVVSIWNLMVPTFSLESSDGTVANAPVVSVLLKPHDGASLASHGGLARNAASPSNVRSNEASLRATEGGTRPAPLSAEAAASTVSSAVPNWAPPPPAVCLDFSSDGRHIACGSSSGELYLLDLAPQLVHVDDQGTAVDWVASHFTC